MEDEERGQKVSKRMSDKEGEVDFKTKAGTAWSHNFLNQKPWHPLSYPNQRRKWIAEQTHAQRQRRADDIAREYAQEQEFLRQTSLLSNKEKEKVDIMQAVSFMYVRPPGYNAESAKAAEVAEERKKLGEIDQVGASSSNVPKEAAPVKEEKKKARPKDVFGRTLPTEEEFSVLKNAPRLETGVAGRAKPFAFEVRNVKCVRCGNFGHQSGDRECPLKDAIMPNDENRLKRDDPLTAIMAQMDPSEPLKWELKQKPGISPPRGGFQPDDPNQQIVAEDIFDEYGGFLSGGIIPELLTNFNPSKPKKKSKSKTYHDDVSLSKGHEDNSSLSNSDNDRRSSKIKSEHGKKKKSASDRQSHVCTNSSASDGGEKYSKLKFKSSSKHKKRGMYVDSDRESYSTSDDCKHRRKSGESHKQNKRIKKDTSLSKMSDSDDERFYRKNRHKDSHSSRYKDSHKDRDKESHKLKVVYEDSSSNGEKKSSRKRETRRKKSTRCNYNESSLSGGSGDQRYSRKHNHSYSSKVSDSNDNHHRLHQR